MRSYAVAKQGVLSLLLLLSLVSGSTAWSSLQRHQQRRDGGVRDNWQRNCYLSACSNEIGDDDLKSHFSGSRREALHLVASGLLASIALPTSVSARNLPLNTGADTSNTGTASTLIPIVRLQRALSDLQSQLVANKIPISLPSNSIAPRDEISFKRLLDAYSDPVSYKQKFVDQNAFLVYYSKGFDGPGRPNIEDDLPVKQTLQYGSRNDAWVAWDDFLVEWDFSQKGEDNQDDLQQALQRTLKALEAYLSLAPTEDLQQARLAVK